MECGLLGVTRPRHAAPISQAVTPLLLSFSLSLTLYLPLSLKLSLTLSVSLTLCSSLSSPCFDNFPSCHTTAKMLKNNALCHQEEEP